MVKFLQGKKAYILAALAALAGIVEFIATGDFSMTAIIALTKTTWWAAVVAAIRAGIAKK